MELEHEKKNDRFYYVFIVMFLVRTIYILFMSRMSELLHFDTSITSYLYYGLMWVFLGLGVLNSHVNLRPRAIVFIAVSFSIALINYLLYPGRQSLILPNKFWEYFITFREGGLINGLMFLFTGILICDYARLMDYLHFTSRITMFAIIFLDIMSFFVFRDKRYDDMGYAYAVCLATCTVMFWYLEQRHPLDGILAMIGIVSILICGTRGPMVCVLVLFAVWAFMYQKKSSIRVTAVTLLLVVLFVFYSGILSGAAESISQSMELKGLPKLRVLDMLQSNSLSDDSGRSDIYQEVLQGAYDHLVFGAGIGGDRLMTDNAYAHNFFVEIISHFGLAGGLILIILFGYYFVSGILDPDRNMAALSVILFCGSVIKLIFSSSYLVLPEFYFLLGMILNRPAEPMIFYAKNNHIHRPPDPPTKVEAIKS